MVTRSELINVLKENVFLSNSKWPQYNLVIDYLSDLAESLGSDQKVLIIERNLLYGGISPFSLIFAGSDVSCLEMTPPGAAERGAYNSKIVECLKPFHNEFKLTRSFSNISEINDCYDYIIIPNIIHHLACEEQVNFFRKVRRLGAIGATLIAFEPTIREVHQSPYHYIMYTPEGLESLLSNTGYAVKKINETGSPFDAACYCLQICKEYIPKEKRDLASSLDEMISLLQSNEGFFLTNFARNNTRFPTAFLIEASV